MEIPLFLMYLALWQEAFQVCGWTLLFRLIYGLLSAVSYHLFRKKCNVLISQPRAKQASVRILKIYVHVQHNLRKQGDLPEQPFAFANCFSSGFVTHHFFLLLPLWQQLWVLTQWEFLHVSRHPCSAGRSLSTNTVTLLQVTKIGRLRCEKCPGKGQFPSG